MWVGRAEFERLTDSNRGLILALLNERTESARAQTFVQSFGEQRAKDDVTIDWLRHRVNALEKERVTLMQRIDPRLLFAAPEIATIRHDTSHLPDFDQLPSLEDVGDAEATRLGITHDADGNLNYNR